MIHVCSSTINLTLVEAKFEEHGEVFPENLHEVATYKLPLKSVSEIPVAALLPKSHSPSTLFLKFDTCPCGT